MEHFRSVCLMTASLGSSASPPGPLSELPVERFLAWCASSGGETFRIPTVDEVMSVWEMAGKVGDSKELHALYLGKSVGDPVDRKKLAGAVDAVLGEFPEGDRERVAGMILAIFSE